MAATEVFSESKGSSPWERFLASEEALGVLWQGAKALAHPVRVKILRLIMTQKYCYCWEFTKKLQMAQSTISQHLKVLKAAGFLWEEAQGPAVAYGIHQKNLKRWKILVASI